MFSFTKYLLIRVLKLRCISGKVKLYFDNFGRSDVFLFFFHLSKIFKKKLNMVQTGTKNVLLWTLTTLQ